MAIVLVFFHQLRRESSTDRPWVVVFHINHQLLPAKKVHFEYSIYLSLQRFDLILDHLQRIYLDLFFMDVLLESAHVVHAVVSAGGSRTCQTLMLITLLFDVVFSLLHSNYDFLKLLFLFVFFSLKFLGFDIVTYNVVRKRELFYLKIHHSSTYLHSFGLRDT